MYPQIEVSAEQQGDRCYEVVCEIHSGGVVRRMSRYYNNKLDGGAEPALQIWDENGERVVAEWYTEGVCVDYEDDVVPSMNPREDCIAIIAAAMFCAGIITMTALLFG